MTLSAVLIEQLLSDGYEISSRKVGDTYQVRLTGVYGNMAMAEASTLETALQQAAEQAGRF